MPLQETQSDAVARMYAKSLYELADAGKSPVEIAATLAEHTGKVELLLNLRRAARRA